MWSVIWRTDNIMRLKIRPKESRVCHTTDIHCTYDGTTTSSNVTTLNSYQLHLSLLLIIATAMNNRLSWPESAKMDWNLSVIACRLTIWSCKLKENVWGILQQRENYLYGSPVCWLFNFIVDFFHVLALYFFVDDVITGVHQRPDGLLDYSLRKKVLVLLF